MTSQTSMLVCPADIAGALPAMGWIVVGVIVAGGLLGLGLRDVLRFSFTRIWAIGGVCFRESVRRRVLWIIPLAVCGAVVVSQLQRAVDEQDVIRQTTKFCLFAAGLVVVMSAIILGCTNLPREIETRVIYTIVTKPTTRLEVIVGKIVGFARIAALILLIMGLFTYGYLSLRAWRQELQVSNRLENDPALSTAVRNKLLHYQETGLLTAREYVHPASVQIMASIDPAAPASAAGLPTSADSIRAIYGDSEEELRFPYTVDRQRLFAPAMEGAEPTDSDGIGKNGMLIGLRLRWHRYGPQSSEPATRPNSPAPPPPQQVNVDVLDANGYNLVNSYAMYDPRYPGAKDAHTAGLDLPASSAFDQTGPFGTPDLIWAYVPASQAGPIFNQPTFQVHVYGVSHNVEYFADAQSVLVMIAPPPAEGQYSPPIPSSLPQDQLIAPDAGPDGQPAPPLVRGRLSGRGGQQLTGKPVRDPRAPFAVFRFDGIRRAAESGGTIPLEINTAIERGGDLDDKTDASTGLTLYVRPAGGKGSVLSDPIDLRIENKQTIFAELPSAAVGDGDFDLIVRCNTPGNLIALDKDSISLTSGEEPFAWNLAKSLLILWMLTVLVVSLAVMCSTFLSWPIAVVLTAVLLMGHWCVTQVADTADKTLGRSIATDMGLTDASKAEAVANSVNALSGVLTVVGVALPDIDRFAAIEAIEHGAVVSSGELTDALGVLAAFGMTAGVVAYLVLKQKEVAP